MNERREELHIGVASPKEMRDRLIAGARGDLPSPGGPKVWMSLEALARLLTPEARRMLAVIAQEHPRSVSALAARIGRDQGNVSRTIGRLEEAGLVRLVSEGREKRPEVTVDRLRIEVDLRQDRLAVV
ncbi:MAG TPA: MarR family transcriptional regulator [Stellaceae bacterium]|nr:MarR family transcriptional regulator [Stellaceae bacterium]